MNCIKGAGGETLGLETRIAMENQVRVHAGATQLIFTQTDDNQHCLYHFAFNVPEKQFETAAQRLAMRADLPADEDGNPTIEPETWNSHSLSFKDTAGNILECIARHGLQ